MLRVFHVAKLAPFTTIVSHDKGEGGRIYFGLPFHTFVILPAGFDGKTCSVENAEYFTVLMPCVEVRRAK